MARASSGESAWSAVNHFLESPDVRERRADDEPSLARMCSAARERSSATERLTVTDTRTPVGSSPRSGSRLHVLIPVLDDDKHYGVNDAEVEKLIRNGEGWLATHPEKGQAPCCASGIQSVLSRSDAAPSARSNAARRGGSRCSVTSTTRAVFEFAKPPT